MLHIGDFLQLGQHFHLLIVRLLGQPRNRAKGQRAFVFDFSGGEVHHDDFCLSQNEVVVRGRNVLDVEDDGAESDGSVRGQFDCAAVRMHLAVDEEFLAEGDKGVRSGKGEGLGLSPGFVYLQILFQVGQVGYLEAAVVGAGEQASLSRIQGDNFCLVDALSVYARNLDGNEIVIVEQPETAALRYDQLLVPVLDVGVRSHLAVQGQYLPHFALLASATGGGALHGGQDAVEALEEVEHHHVRRVGKENQLGGVFLVGLGVGDAGDRTVGHQSHAGDHDAGSSRIDEDDRPVLAAEGDH
jgi:hypothetical protein